MDWLVGFHKIQWTELLELALAPVGKEQLIHHKNSALGQLAVGQLARQLGPGQPGGFHKSRGQQQLR